MDILKSKQIYFWVLFIVISRYITHIVYIEDIDSLRFALATKEFDLTKFQPHFPAYPIYCFITKLMYWLTSSISFSHYFSGVVGMILVFVGGREFYKEVVGDFNTVLLDVLTVSSPLIWLMSNRYMPDIMGLGLLMLALNWGLKYYKNTRTTDLCCYIVCVGLLAGVRVSYLPCLFPISVWFLWKGKEEIFTQVVFYIGSVMLWLVPLVFITGWVEIVDLLFSHTDGHFNEWGGTINTDNNLVKRFYMIFVYIWSDGLGGWLPNRSPLFVPFSILLLYAFIKGRNFFKLIPVLVMICLVTYFIWAFLYQNVLYKPRHLMPFLPFCLMAVAYGGSELKKSFVVVLLIVLSVPNVIVAYQHKYKVALAQVKDYIEVQKLPLVTNQLVAYYMNRNSNKIKIVEQPKGKCLAIGVELEGRIPSDTTIFYHNPYVNRMWSKIKVYHYE